MSRRKNSVPGAPSRAGLTLRLLAATIASVAVGAAGEACAQQLVYTPVNPTFGGNPFNSTQLLAQASAQNQYKPATAKPPTQAELFAQQLQSRLLTALASQITDAIFGADPQNSGTITFGDQTISFVRTLENVTLTIVDSKGVSTVITVPTFVKIQ